MSCVVTRKPHDLVEILRARESGLDAHMVVNWCRDCGAVVIDGEYDGHVLPGKHRAMRFPRLALDAAKPR